MIRSKPFMTCRRVQCDMLCPPAGSRTTCHHLQPVYAAIIETSNRAAQAMTNPSARHESTPEEAKTYTLVFSD